MAKRQNTELPRDKIADFCKRNRIRKLSLFGSALRGELRKDSDIDFLVEFQLGETPSLFDLGRMERELSTVLGGRKVDLRTPQELSRYFRDEVLASASVQYAEG
jgi:predicted nucleotidyltransferase